MCKTAIFLKKGDKRPGHFFVRVSENEECLESADYNCFKKEYKRIIDIYQKDGYKIINYLEPMKTVYGLEFCLVAEIDLNWDNYNKVIANIHLANVGVIIIDCIHNKPIDNEYDLAEIYLQLEKLQGSGTVKLNSN